MYKTVSIPLSGHPDKVCDQIVDAIVDEYLRRDAKSRVNIQALGSHGMLMIGGAVESRADFDSGEIAKRIYKEIGYKDEIEPFVNIESFKSELKNGAACGTTIMHGYATRETREMLPRVFVYANALAKRIDDLRKRNSDFDWIFPDGKVQLTMEGKDIISVVTHVQHLEGVDLNHIKKQLVDNAIVPILGEMDGVKLHVNTAGKFSIGGFDAGIGASGRKVGADTHGGLLPSGGAHLSGRDPLHPARAGRYMARFVAKNLVKKGLADNVLISLAYTIGQAHPIFIEARGGKGEDLTSLVSKEYDFRPEAIVEQLNLRQPIYKTISTFGQFGRPGLPWEEE